MLFIDIDIMISLKGIQDLLIHSLAAQREGQELGVVGNMGAAKVEESHCFGSPETAWHCRPLGIVRKSAIYIDIHVHSSNFL